MRNDDKNGEAAHASSYFLRVISGAVRFGGMLSTLAIILVFILVIFAIVRRYFLGAPLLWGDEFIGYALVALVMLGAAEALRKGDHISIDLLSSRVGPRGAVIVDIFGSFAVLLFAFVLGTSTWSSIRFAYDFGSYSIGYVEIATWIPQVPMLLGSVLLGLAATTRIMTLLTTERWS